MFLQYILILMFCCAVVSSKSTSPEIPTVRVILHVNGKAVNPSGKGGKPNYIDNYKYDVNDTLDFSCYVNMTEQEGYYYSLVHQEHGVNTTIPSVPKYLRHVTNILNYTITVEDFDTGSKIYCIVTKLDAVTNISAHFAESAPLKLIMQPVSGETSSNSRYEIQSNDYIKNNHTCNISESVLSGPEIKQITLSSSDKSSIYFCQIINSKWSTKTPKRLVFSRKIYNKIEYLNTPIASNDSLPSSTRIGIGVGVVICVALVTSLLLRLLFLRYKRKKARVDEPLYQEIELYARPNELVYADLELSETAPSANVPHSRSDSPYAIIIGFMSRK